MKKLKDIEAKALQLGLEHLKYFLKKHTDLGMKDKEHTIIRVFTLFLIKMVRGPLVFQELEFKI